MYSQGVGNKSSILYISWAQQLGGQGNVPQACIVIQRGIQNEAQPIEKLHQQYRYVSVVLPVFDSLCLLSKLSIMTILSNQILHFLKKLTCNYFF